jgi:RND family efflux transporter MFP subunit
MKKYIIAGLLLSAVGYTTYNKVYVPKHTFQTITAKSDNMSVAVNGVGEVGSKEYYKIGSIYGGKVLNLHINEGDFIKKGTLIANIDSVDLNSKIDELKASINKINSDISSLKIDKQSAITSYNYQNKILNKNEKLYKRKAISELDFEKYKTNATIAKLKIKSISSKINSLDAQKMQLTASLRGLNQRLSRFTVTSPIDGYVVKKYISNYAIINPNQTILEIVNPKDIWVAAYIDTRISGDVKIGNSATIKLRSSNIEYKGTVVNIKPINNNITYEREVDVAFNKLPLPFYLQEQAQVSISTKLLTNIIKVPTKSLSIYKQKEGVWILKDSKVKFKEIKILAHKDNFVATKDVSNSDTIVIPDANKKSLSNGMKINKQ